MAAFNDNKPIDLLFGVAGGDSLDSGSGARIKEDIDRIVKKLKDQKHTELQFSISQASLTKLREDIRKAVQNIPITVNVQKQEIGAGTDQRDDSQQGTSGLKKRIKELQAEESEVLKVKRAYRDFYQFQADALSIDAIDSKGLAAQNKVLDKAQQKYAEAEKDLKKYSWTAQQLADIEAYAIRQEEQFAQALAEHERAQISLQKATHTDTAVLERQSQALSEVAHAAQQTAAGMDAAQAELNEEAQDGLRAVRLIEQIRKQLLNFDAVANKQQTLAVVDAGQLQKFKAEADMVRHSLLRLGVDSQTADYNLEQLGDTEQLHELLMQITNLTLGLRNVSGAASNAEVANTKLETSYHKLANRAHDYMVRIQGSLSRDPGMMREMQDLVDRLHRGDFESVAHGAQEFQKLQFRIKQAGLEAETLSQKISRIFKEKFGFGVMATAALYARRAIGDVYRTVVDLDTKLTELKIVSGETGATMVKYMDEAAAAAKRVASSITDIIDATTVYRRLGFEMNKSLDFAELTTMYSKVGNVDMSQAEENITAIIKAYNLEDIDKLRYALDQMVATGNNLPISAQGLGTALNNAASSLVAAGNNFQESLALLTASNTITQDPNKASTALRTISARLRQSTAELEELGEELDETYNTVSAYQAKFKSLTGVDILEEDQETYKSTYQILKELSEVWEDLSDMDKQAVTYMASGIRQGNIFSSIMTEFADAEKTLEVTANAAGSMQTAYENYIDSIQGRLNTLTASSQELFNNLLDSDLIKSGVSAVTALVEALNSLIETIGVLPTIGAGVGLYKLISSVGGAKWIALINAPTYVPVVTRSELAA